MQKLYVVRTTRVVLAESPGHAKAIANTADNPDDVDTIQQVNGLYDIPTEWLKSIPYGADNLDTLHCLAAQFAADPAYDAFECHPCLKAGEDEAGNAVMEQCDEYAAGISVWSVYGHLVTGGLECLADFDDRSQAVEFVELIQKAAMFQAIHEQGEDAHLEAAYEDRVTGGDYDAGDW
jgi:hypothetical protein